MLGEHHSNVGRNLKTVMMTNADGLPPFPSIRHKGSVGSRGTPASTGRHSNAMALIRWQVNNAKDGASKLREGHLVAAGNIPMH